MFPASLPTPVKQWWYSTALSTYTRAKEFKGSQNCKIALYALAPPPSTLGPLPSQPWALSLSSAVPLTPQSLCQSVSDWYLSFWTHFSSAFPEDMWIFLLLNPTARRTLAGFASYWLPLYKPLPKIQNGLFSLNTGIVVWYMKKRAFCAKPRRQCIRGMRLWPLYFPCHSSSQ